MERFIRKYLSIVQWVGLGVLVTQVSLRQALTGFIPQWSDHQQLLP